MFKFIIIFLSLFFNSQAFAKETVILTSFYPIHIATMNVVSGIQGIKLVIMTKPFAGCLHDYALTPKDMITLSKADYFVVNGLGMESFLNKAMQLQKKLIMIEASKGITSLIKDSHGDINPHLWPAPTLAIKQVENIASQLGEQLPQYQNQFRKNAIEYIKKIETLREKMKKETSSLKTREFITFHEAFVYFAREFDLKIPTAIEREPGTEPTAREMAEIIKIIKKSSSKVIFTEPQYSPKSAEIIAKASGASIYHLDPVVTGEYKKEAYLEIMKLNLATLIKALSK